MNLVIFYEPDTHIPRSRAFSSFHTSVALSAPVYDSSSSPEARVYFIDSGEGCYLKSASAGALAKEADMTRYMHRKGLGAEVLAYLSGERDWLLTARLPGEDCTHPACLENPRLLCDKMAEALRLLHDADFAGCPVPNRTADYLEAVPKKDISADALISPFFLPTIWVFHLPTRHGRLFSNTGKALKPIR